MALVCPDQKGEILLLQYIVGMTLADNPVLHLYSNNLTPSDSTTIAQLTEVSSSGYAAITLLSAQWTTTQAGGVTTAVYSEQTFAFTTVAESYGYYVTDESNNPLWLERFVGAPFQIPDGGGTISITAKLTLS